MVNHETRKAKGVLVAQHVRILRKARDESLLAGLTPAQRDIVASHILPSTWYPYEIYERTLDIIFNKLSDARPEAARAMGQFMACEMLLGSYSMYLKRGDPVATLGRFPIMWKNYFNFARGSFGTPCDAEEGKPQNVIETAIEDFPDLPYPLFLIIQGFGEKASELAGAVQPVVCKDEGWRPGPLCYTSRIAWQKVSSP